jgi:two-component system chemotaxis response regulator CheB
VSSGYRSGRGGLIRVLVVDDSAYNRRVIGEMLTSIEGVEVVASACDGQEALQMALDHKPDLITLDLEMPRMDGFSFLRLLMSRQPTPVIIISGYAKTANVFRALELGAIDFVAKPTRAVAAALPLIRAELAEKVALVRHVSPAQLKFRRPSVAPLAADVQPRVVRGANKIVVVGASTGGPTALVRLFRELPTSLGAAVIVAQHMPPKFTRTFSERLDRISPLQVREASGVHSLKIGQAWVCPGGQSVEIGADASVLVRTAREDDRYVPSVDRLFESAATKFGARCLGVVLTGMGDDGCRGAKAVRERGGRVIVESIESAAIYGMPGAVERAGHADEVLPLREMAARIIAFARGTF